MGRVPWVLFLALALLASGVRAASLDGVDAALARVGEYVREIQRPDGTWVGLVEADPRSTAFYLVAHAFTGRAPDARTDGIERFLRAVQRPDGAFEVWPGGGADVGNTRFCHLALEGARTPEGREAHERAGAWLAAQPDLPEPDVFWNYFLALTGKIGWGELPHISTRVVSLPDWFHPNIYDLSFVRIAVVSIALMQAYSTGAPRAPAPAGVDRAEGRPPTRGAGTRAGSPAVDAPPVSAADARAPTPGTWRRLARWVGAKARGGFWSGLLALSRVADRLVPPARANERAVAWLLERQEADGSFFAAAQMTALAVMTLHRVDPVAHADAIDRGFEAMHRWQVEDARGRWQQFTDSTNWDTSSCVQLLLALGEDPGSPRITKAVAYLRSKQATVRADWSHRVPDLEPGGWSFQRHADWYPDVDDTALAVHTLLEADPGGSAVAARRGIRWILGMQNRDGGWASWDRNDRGWVELPGAGPWIARDPSYADITARLSTLLAQVARGDHPELADLRAPATRALRKARRWMEANRHGPAWMGAWFTHYLHGTGEVLEAYRAMGLGADHPEVRAARDWVLAAANPDGGFGESPASGVDEVFRPAPSTAFHTASALKALIHAGAADHPVATRAARWLVEHQAADGSWVDEDMSGVGIPGLWYIRYYLVPTYVAGEVLHAYREATRRDP